MSCCRYLAIVLYRFFFFNLNFSFLFFFHLEYIRSKKERQLWTVLGGGHDGRRRRERPDGVVQQGADDGRSGAGHGHLQLHEGKPRRRQGQWQPSDRHAHGGEFSGAAPQTVRRGGSGHNGYQLSGRRGTVSRVPKDGGDRVARHANLQNTPDVGRLFVVWFVVVVVPGTDPVPVIPITCVLWRGQLLLLLLRLFWFSFCPPIQFF